eukprot:7509143-Lingulodinium_polyedra.AAC.1
MKRRDRRTTSPQHFHRFLVATYSRVRLMTARVCGCPSCRSPPGERNWHEFCALRLVFTSDAKRKKVIVWLRE